MSYVIDGCNYSYDYEELIQELKNDIEEGAISPWNIIKIVRNKDSVIDEIDYKPIIDYYLPKDFEMINGKLEDVFNKEDFSEDEWNSFENDRNSIIEQYNKDKERLEEATVTAVLTEMELWNAIV